MEKNEIEQLYNELLIDNEKTKQMNNDLNNKKQKIIESLEKGINELEEAKLRVKDLEMEKDELSKRLGKAEEFNDKILADYESVLEKLNEADKHLKEFESAKNELNLSVKENIKLNKGKKLIFIFLYFQLNLFSYFSLL